MRLFALLKWLLSRFMLIDNYCRKCGRKTEVFTVEDQLWIRATGDSPPLCFRHFNREAKRRGLSQGWGVRIIVFALWCAISLFGLVSPASAVDLLQPGQTAQRQGILLDIPTAFRVLAVLEDYPRLKEENAALRGVIARQDVQIERHQVLDEIRVEREKLYQERIAFLELQAGKWQQLNEATLALAKQNREAQGSWFDRLAHDAGKMTLGAIVGAAIAAALIL